MMPNPKEKLGGDISRVARRKRGGSIFNLLREKLRQGYASDFFRRAQRNILRIRNYARSMPVIFFRRAQRKILRNSNSSKIFGVGHGRTGTRSLVAAANILGYKLMHNWGDINYDELNRKDGGTDNAFAARYVELDQKYPGSKFIYTNRSLETWLDSCKRQIPKKKPCEVGSPKYNTRVLMFGYDLGLGYKEELLIEAFTSHQTQILDYFKGRPDDLLILNIIDGEGWEKLCPFLNAPIPDIDFPHWG